ncbi:MAG TPA: UDP-N-acetylmuramoyl-tripeptide--D-alanyl-D-alanine ligase [Syntrophomonadaceae bacterium]|nr:UDP-N-acetylmuramoyl-tripeptide--D-alanyl-D-alanine ligase [Syntrophomonadaceae bacterium]
MLNTEWVYLLTMSLEKLAALLHGRILVGSDARRIPLSVSRIGGTPAAALTFLKRPYVSEQGLLTRLQHHQVRCLVVQAPHRFSLSKWRRAGICIIQVPNLSHAYLTLARYYSRKYPLPRTQVIGSSGKTTTKEMIGAVLQEKFNTLTGRQNLNNPLGVAYNLLCLNETHQTAVIEAGMKGSGVMRLASRLIRPDIGVLTSIHSAHLASFGSIGKIIAAKAEILEYLSPRGTFIINWSDPNCRRFPLHRFQGKVVRYGFTPDCDLWASDIQRQDFRTIFTVNTMDLQFPCAINIIGRYNVGNALAAIAVGLEQGLVPEEIVRGLERFQPVDGRLKVYQSMSGAMIIDDNFNANPDSTRLLVDELITMAQEKPVVLVLGDMERPSHNITKYARRVHYRIGQQLAKGDFQHVLAVGYWAKEYLRGAIKAGFPREKISYFPSVQAARSLFNKLLTPGTIAVLKASPYTEVKQLRMKSSVQPL